MRSSVLVVLGVVGLVACDSKSSLPQSVSPPPPAAPSVPAATAAAPAPATWDNEILAIAASYKSYGIIAERPQWAPTLCAAPPSPPRPETPRLSDAKEPSPHGEKLYFLYARDYSGYVKTGKEGAEAPAGQVVVKEAFAPAALAANAPPTKDVLYRGNKAFVPGQRLGLFVMKKVGKGPATDDGWIYAVTDAEGKHVTASGNLPTCAGCHRSAPHDRLFAKDI